ncbi:hypothetical protein ACFJIV_12530 [Mucilaginibacter sp. UC70_90]
MKGKNVSRDTKSASLNAKKEASAYQTGKTSVSKIELSPVTKKKK